MAGTANEQRLYLRLVIVLSYQYESIFSGNGKKNRIEGKRKNGNGENGNGKKGN